MRHNPWVSPVSPITAFGGTFDPVHWGHLRVAADAASSLGLPEVRLIPSKRPVHREATGASAEHRLAMLRLAAAEVPGLAVDARELERASPSYTVLTLESLRAEYPQRPLVWLIGLDAFLGLPSWREWTRLFELAHFVVLNRPGYGEVPQAVIASLPWVSSRQSDSKQVLFEEPAGRVLLHLVPPQPISATAIRQAIARDVPEASYADWLPRPVLAYIREHRLYRREPPLASQ